MTTETKLTEALDLLTLINAGLRDDDGDVMICADEDGKNALADRIAAFVARETSAYPEWMDADEKTVCGALLTSILGEGYLVRVYEGEEGEAMTKITTDRMAIEKETAASGITLWRVYEERTETHSYVGTAVLIHGNGVDVISDFSAPNGELLDRMEKLGEEAQKVADSIE